ncbi:NADP-dependent 3-hydroxy acid dehydrogenase YdfG [Trueperella bonasi]|uniref:NADP-dependent 3-hydroxy acid dehydrogenase YdfG n=1 Tax=Trueperella bonasi TaxID=312286 RepID=A0ABT9NHT0_9ACTO|nr:SDR family oxidoreductase [Trueperella bonasi]MDP9806909.1 NADP-dependent 3-hydroxy acid dehydrogenase YdfG [Trueperella bonasi]
MARIALVTGATTGIGAATVRALCAESFDVVATGRRSDRLERLSEETGCRFVAGDLTNDDDVAAIAEFAGNVDVLVNNAGGAVGLDSVAEGKVSDWQKMYDINVLGALRITQKVLPVMREHGGDVVFISSTAGHESYVGGGGYTAAKHAEREIAKTLRLELVGEPVRIIDIAPGLVKTEEFSLNRFSGDMQRAEQVYAGVAEPLLAEDIAEAVRWAVTLPSHVNIDSMIIRPVAQANSWTIAREN